METSVRPIPEDVALRRAAELVTSALALAPFGVALAREGTIIAVNQRLAGWHVTPLAPERLIGTAIAGPDEHELANALVAAEHGEARELALEQLSLLGDRRGAWRLYALPFAIETHRVVAVLIEDQSEQTHTAEAFAASERRFRLLVDCANDGIAVHRDGVLLYANPAAVRILGFSRPEELIGRPMIDFVHPDDRQLVLGRIANVARGVAAPLREATLLRQDGSMVVVEASGSRAPMGEGYANFVFFRDITERKQLQADAQRAHRMDSLGRLAGGIAHDFNNLISSIQSALALARSSASDPEALLQALAQAESATSRAADLTRQLLTFSRGGETVASSVDPNDVVHETVGLLGLAAERLTLELDLDPAVGKVWIDPSRLHQVVMNLLLNARDALRSGGEIRVTTARVRIEGELSESQARAGDWISIEVADTGAGMSLETQSRIFEPFFTTKPSGQGTGLGLSTVYGVVRQAGGWVEVQSELGRGTRFVVYLPVLGVTTVPPESMARPQQGKEPQRVLVCDDEVRLAMLTAGLLEQRGFEVVTVSSGIEALEALMQPDAHYDALLLDVNLSGMSAAELLAAVVERGLSVPVVLSSGYSEEDLPLGLRQQALVVGYLAKPYPLERLYEVIDRAALSARG